MKAGGSSFAIRARVLCRIESRVEGGRLIVRLAGHLSEAHVPALLEACAPSTGPARLELDELRSADGVGVDALMRLKRRGVELIALPEYLRLKLEKD